MEVVKKPVPDIAELQSIQDSVEQVRTQVLKKFFDLLKQQPGRPPIVLADFEAARKEAGDAFAAHARAINARNLAIRPVDEDLILKAIDEWHADHQLETQRALPLHKVPDLTAHGLRLVGRVHGSSLWISTILATIVSDEGMCAIYLREADEPDDDWCTGWLPVIAFRQPVCRSMDYPLHGLINLVATLGFARLVPLPEERMQQCRQPMITPTEEHISEPPIDRWINRAALIAAACAALAFSFHILYN